MSGTADVGISIHYVLAVDDHRRNLRYTYRPSIDQALLGCDEILLQALRIVTAKTLLHDCGGSMRVCWQTLGKLCFKAFRVVQEY
ncbi:hypothetical protein IBA8403_03020 [Pseudomonas syringae]